MKKTFHSSSYGSFVVAGAGTGSLDATAGFFSVGGFDADFFEAITKSIDFSRQRQN
jgi:hypothetical protein